LPLYKWTRELSPDFPYGRYSYALCLFDTGHYADAKRMAYVALSAGADYKSVRGVLAAADSMIRVKGADSSGGSPPAAPRPIGSGKVP
jgi:hypothetical protein